MSTASITFQDLEINYHEDLHSAYLKLFDNHLEHHIVRSIPDFRQYYYVKANLVVNGRVLIAREYITHFISEDFIIYDVSEDEHDIWVGIKDDPNIVASKLEIMLLHSL